MWNAHEIKKNVDKIVLRDSIQFWDNALYAMRVMSTDAPNPIDKDLLDKIIANLDRRKSRMQMELDKL